MGSTWHNDIKWHQEEHHRNSYVFHSETRWSSGAVPFPSTSGHFINASREGKQMLPGTRYPEQGSFPNEIHHLYPEDVWGFWGSTKRSSCSRSEKTTMISFARNPPGYHRVDLKVAPRFLEPSFPPRKVFGSDVDVVGPVRGNARTWIVIHWRFSDVRWEEWNTGWKVSNKSTV